MARRANGGENQQVEKEKLEVIKVIPEKHIQERIVEQTVNVPVPPEQTTQPAPPLQQSHSMLVKFGLPEQQSTVPQQNPTSQCPLVKLGLLGPKLRAQPVLT